MANDSSGTESKSGLFNRRAPITIIGVLVLAVVASAIYDILIRPGFNEVSSFVFDVITLGSQAAKDYAFNSAAMDPTALPATVILIVAFGMIAGSSLALVFSMWRIGRLVTRTKELTAEPKEFVVQTKRRIVRLRLLGLLTLPFILLPIFFLQTTLNQTVLIWRIFNTNMTIISPYIDKTEQQQLRASFASMQNESDYNKIAQKISAIAESNAVTLRDETPIT